MAVTTSSTATIRGIKYSRGSSFKCYASYYGAAGSEGEGSAAALTKGTTYYFYAAASGSSVDYPYAVCTSSSASASSIRGWYTADVFPYATYSVKYNANGGSGAPSTQTKTYGTNLTLSSTKPTRTGYTFQGWGTTASDTSVNYAAGATYSSNAAITLYAIWKANTYTISFNANGGSGAPSSVTKTYGVTLKLPTAIPTRTNYTFLGWSTNKSATTATYSAGGSYTNNSAATLYAIWKVNYKLPTVSNIKAVRCNSDGTANDTGVYAKVTFNWSCDQDTGANNVSSITVNGVAATSSEGATGTSGTVTKVVGGSYSIETNYDIPIVVTDTLQTISSGKTTAYARLSSYSFVIDFKSGGTGVTFGAPATEDGFNCVWDATFDGTLDVAGDTTIGGTLGLDGSITIPNAKYYNARNSSGTIRSLAFVNSSDQTHFGYGSYANNEGSTYYNGNTVGIRSNGNIYMTAPSAGLSARAYGVNKVLWTGTYFMTDAHTVTLSEAVSAQPHGIVLLWSPYISSAAANYGFQYTFIPKNHASARPNGGIDIPLFRATSFSKAAMKYIFVSDTTVTGYSSNSSAGTGSTTIVYDNDYWVLRAVIGV